MVAGLLLASLVVAQPTPAERIAAGEATMASLDYEAAADELMLAASDPRATGAQQIHASLLAGIANRIAGRNTDARLNFRFVLLAAPDTRLPPETSPKIVAYFELVRRELDAERLATAPSTPSTAPTTSPASPATAAATPPAGPPIAAWATAGLGAALVVTGGAVAVFSEAAVGDAPLDGGDKQAWLYVGWAGLGVAALGAAAAGTGVALGMLD